jgi:hypothetical protein
MVGDACRYLFAGVNGGAGRRDITEREGSPLSGPAVMRVLVGVGWSRLRRTRRG